MTPLKSNCEEANKYLIRCHNFYYMLNKLTISFIHNCKLRTAISKDYQTVYIYIYLVSDMYSIKKSMLEISMNLSTTSLRVFM